MECTEFVYKQTGIFSGHYHNAGLWDDDAAKRGFKLSYTPKNNCIMVIESSGNGGVSVGHVAIVESASLITKTSKYGKYRVDTELYKLTISHANFNLKGTVKLHDTAIFKDIITFRDDKKKIEHVGSVNIPSMNKSKWYATGFKGAFITNWK